MLVSAREDLLGRLGKSIIFSLLALLHLSHKQCYKMTSQTAALLYVTAPHSPAALEPKFRGLSDCSLAMEHSTQRVVCSAFLLQTPFKLLVTLPHFSNSTWHFLCLRLVSWCEAFTKPVPQLVNIKWLCQCIFFLSFFNLQGQILGWCLQLTTAMYLDSCRCYLGKLQTVQKALCFQGAVNSHLGMRLFFLLWVRACLGHGLRELRSTPSDEKPESWGASCASVWPWSGTNSAKIMLTLGYFCMMLHNASQRWWGVRLIWITSAQVHLYF